VQYGSLAFIDSESTLRTATHKNFDLQARLSPDWPHHQAKAIGPCGVGEESTVFISIDVCVAAPAQVAHGINARL
jgi:hypothetical protein